jgi:hypothetical protein
MKPTGTMLSYWIIITGSIWGIFILLVLLSKICKKDTGKTDVNMEQGFKDKYEHVGDKPLGAGACGATWKVKEKGSDSDVFYASKEAHNEDMIIMFKAEKETLSICDHPHICKYFDGFGEGKIGSAIILELLSGKNINE